MKKKNNFEDKLLHLESIIGKLESGSISLEEMLELFEEGKKLTTLCQNELKKIEKRINSVTLEGDQLIEKKIGIKS